MQWAETKYEYNYALINRFKYNYRYNYKYIYKYDLALPN